MAFFVFLGIITLSAALIRGRVARWFVTVAVGAVLVAWADKHPGVIRAAAIVAVVLVMAFAAYLDRLKSRRPTGRR